VVEDALTLTGRADPWEQVVVSAEVSGNVTGQEVEEGDRAGNGQVFFRIDTIWFQAAHAQAEAKAVLARQELERVEGLRRGGISSPQDLDRVRAEHTVAEADLAAARMRLDKSVVHAPMNGVVDRVHVERGEWAEMGKPLVRLVQVDRIKVVAGVPESDIRHFALGDTVQIQFDALPDQVFTGDVLRIATTAEAETRTFPVEVAVDNAAGGIRPGMIARVRMVRAVHADAVAVPIFSILSMENQHFVFVEENGVARVRPVSVGVIEGDRVHIREGLAPGDRLIVVGHRDLREGQPVRVTAEAGE
jgi:membrane fusion protein (multidrug efflux system)